MVWPTSLDKANTTYVDNATDPIWRARYDIKQNIDNVNAIIDEFNIASPADNSVMEYNSSTSRFEPSQVENIAPICLISLDNTLPASVGNAQTDYTGTFTIENSGTVNTTGITTGSTGGLGTIVFPAGVYVIRLPINQTLQSTSMTSLETFWKTSSTVHWSGFTKTSGFTSGNPFIPHYLLGSAVTFTETRTVTLTHRVTNTSGGAYTHPNLNIVRIS